MIKIVPDIYNTKDYENGQVACEQAHSIFWEGIKNNPELQKQANNIMESNGCDIDPTFLGFLGGYYYLSMIIPLDRIIYDMGCGYGFQSWFFRKHKQYIGVDINLHGRFELANTQYYQLTISDFIVLDLIESPHFAICNYVPPWGDDNGKLVKHNFQHVFVFYP